LKQFILLRKIIQTKVTMDYFDKNLNLC